MIIKAGDRPHVVHGVSFNFDDIAKLADSQLERVRAEADRILAKARADAQAIRAAAREQGLKTALDAADQIVSAKLETLLPALRQAIDEIRQSKHAWLAQWERCAVHVAATIAGRLIRREVSRTPEITLSLVKEALDLATGGSEVRIHLHPLDHQALGTQVRLLADEFSRLAPAEVVDDDSVSRGSCRVTTRWGAIDQQWEAQLARIEEELS